jgi:hypothetical protein
MHVQATVGNTHVPEHPVTSEFVDRKQSQPSPLRPIGGDGPSDGTQLLGWPFTVPVPMPSIPRTPAPPSNDDGQGPYFRGKFAPRRLHQDNENTYRVNLAELIALKQAAHALANPIVRFNGVTVVREVPATVQPTSAPEAAGRPPSKNHRVKSKRRRHSQGNAVDDPITIDASPRRPSTSRIVDDPSSKQPRRGTSKSRRDHIKRVHPTVKFPHLDFIDRPGLTAAPRPPYSPDPAGEPWPNSIVTFTFIRPIICAVLIPSTRNLTHRPLQVH